METREHPKPYRFMPELERMEPLILDHTAIITAKRCLRAYFFQIVCGGVPRGDSPQYFVFGGAYHEFRRVLELEYKKDPNGEFFKTALIKALIYYTTITSGAKLENGKLVGGKRDAAGSLISVDPPVGSKWDFLTKERLIKSCKAGYDHFIKEKQNGKIQVLATEQAFNVQIVDGEHTSGRFDQIIRHNGKVWGRDFKTSSKEGPFYARGLDPNDQFTRYTYAEQKLAGEKVRGQFIEVLYNSKKEGPRITTYLSERTQWQLDDWEADEIFMRETINRAREQDRWPKQEHNCGFCQFHSVCKMGSPGSQVAKFKQEFTQRAWDNMTVHLVPEG